VCWTVIAVTKQRQAMRCNAISVSIDYENAFLDKNMVMNFLKTNDIKIDSTVLLRKLNFDQIEATLAKNNYIKKAEIFADFWGNIQINIIQKTPIVRVITKENKHFYISNEKEMIPISQKFTPIVPVLSGEIKEDFINFNATNNFTNKLFDYLKLIHESALWRNMITQIYITKDTTIYLQSRIGDQKIILGKINDYEFKMNKLKSLYTDLFATNDINKYKEINLIYSNQIVCKKR
jgi:cell division protein FtsQ